MFNLLDKLAFILNSSTWDIASFSLEKLLVREEVISIIDLFMQLLYSTSGELLVLLIPMFLNLLLFTY